MTSSSTKKPVSSPVNWKALANQQAKLTPQQMRQILETETGRNLEEDKNEAARLAFLKSSLEDTSKWEKESPGSEVYFQKQNDEDLDIVKYHGLDILDHVTNGGKAFVTDSRGLEEGAGVLLGKQVSVPELFAPSLGIATAKAFPKMPTLTNEETETITNAREQVFNDLTKRYGRQWDPASSGNRFKVGALYERNECSTDFLGRPVSKHKAGTSVSGTVSVNFSNQKNSTMTKAKVPAKGKYQPGDRILILTEPDGDEPFNKPFQRVYRIQQEFNDVIYNIDGVLQYWDLVTDSDNVSESDQAKIKFVNTKTGVEGVSTPSEVAKNLETSPDEALVKK